MAYKMPSNPDALPHFAEPEREGQPPRQQQPAPPPKPPMQGIRHASTYSERPMQGQMQSSQSHYGSNNYQSPSMHMTPNYNQGGLGPRTSPRPGPSPSPHLPPQHLPPQHLPPQQHNLQPGPSPRLPPSPSRDPDLQNALVPLFRAVDKNNCGQLSERELGSALVNGDFRPFDPHTVRMMIRMFDSDRSGTIGFDEFCGLWSFLSQWRNLFDRFDRDNSGNISLQEFREALYAFRYRLSDRFTDILFRQYDKHNEGHLSFDLFVQASITLKRMTDTFKKYDDDRDGFITLAFEDFLEEILKQMR
jgi:Ca2+-binding EF-hand superfamily protein